MSIDTSAPSPTPANAVPKPLVDVRNLSVTFTKKTLFRPTRTVRAVNDVTFQIPAGQTLGLVGESGSGKSTTGRALLRLVPITTGTASINGNDMAAQSGSRLREARRDMQMIFQDPYSSLDPSATVGASIAEPMLVHEKVSSRTAANRTKELLDLVGLRPSHVNRYPYEFSGGQRQRIAIARALALNPKFIVCDEAVSALDVSTQNQVINLLEDLREQFQLTYLFIAHDLAIVRHISHSVAVMYLGRIVETGPAERIYNSPAHPYTQALLSAIPDASRNRKRRERIVLAGDLPDPSDPPTGCPFQTRCPYVMEICRTENPPMTEVLAGGSVACHLQTAGPTLSGESLPDPADMPHLSPAPGAS
ncbi:ATP-binding cassette domain-containing protein [Epidermidibacterium keratini]|uniref:ATP-binding cassette domain-containing protein n=1 Tax=Epidermidibacterium keratini TaxID=1891644 RepID=A0A7L4YL62_9ACTN|nr:oligopeptide/dipeptide ABC transporter ATP-binding protein [Epidermidibacterium keratini]QHB99915.1 ATP-binding cassette domain-containing protein [Epidermidibacterium keratini]